MQTLTGKTMSVADQLDKACEQLQAKEAHRKWLAEEYDRMKALLVANNIQFDEKTFVPPKIDIAPTIIDAPAPPAAEGKGKGKKGKDAAAPTTAEAAPVAEDKPAEGAPAGDKGKGK